MWVQRSTDAGHRPVSEHGTLCEHGRRGNKKEMKQSGRPANYKNKSIVLRRCETIGRQQSLGECTELVLLKHCICCGAVKAPPCDVSSGAVVGRGSLHSGTEDKSLTPLSPTSCCSFISTAASHNTKSQHKVTTQSYKKCPWHMTD